MRRFGKNNSFSTLYIIQLYIIQLYNFTFYITLISTPKHLEIALTFCFFCVKTKERGIRTYISCNTHGLQIRAIGSFCFFCVKTKERRIKTHISCNTHGLQIRAIGLFVSFVSRQKKEESERIYLVIRTDCKSAQSDSAYLQFHYLFSGRNSKCSLWLKHLTQKNTKTSFIKNFYYL